MFTTKSRWKRKPLPASAFVDNSACCSSDSTATIVNSPLEYKPPQKMVPNIGVFRVRRANRVSCQVSCPIVTSSCTSHKDQEKQDSTHAKTVSQHTEQMHTVYTQQTRKMLHLLGRSSETTLSITRGAFANAAKMVACLGKMSSSSFHRRM